MNYEVAIVGAGPGGTVLARELAKKNISVTIFEKGNYEELGHDWSDAVEKEPLEKAGFELPELEEDYWVGDLVKDGENEEGIFEPHAFPTLNVFSPDKDTVKEIDFNLIVTDRRKLGQKLVDQAIKEGAKVKYEHEGLELIYRDHGGEELDDVEVTGVRVKDLNSGKIEEVKADIVVESSGFECVLRKSLPDHNELSKPFSEENFAIVQREVRRRDTEKSKEDKIPDHYRYGFHSGYQWTHIHTDDKIDVGAGVKEKANVPDPEEILENFIGKHPSIKDKKIRGGRSRCIVGNSLTNFVLPGFLVLGDAASTSIPTTGCGVGSALMSGLWSAEVLEEAAEEDRNDMDKLWEINKKFYLENQRGSNLAALSGTREMLQSFNHEELNFLFEKNLLGSKTLEKAINGKFGTDNMLKSLKGAIRGIENPKLISKLIKILFIGKMIKNHYKNYPEKWSLEDYIEWKEKSEKLFKLCKEIN